MYTTRLTGLAIALGLGLAVTPAAAQQDIRTDKLADPVVLIATDTSGSLEFLDAEGVYPATLPPCFNGDTRDANCAGTCTAPAARPRHIVAKEVLTGVYEGYGCRSVPRSAAPTFDDGYSIPHFEPTFSRHARETGLIRRNRELVRFGFASFDGDARGDDTDSFTSAGESLQWNLGIRSVDAGNSPLVGFGDLNNPADGIEAAVATENSVAAFIPFGATPIAAMFRDLRTYIPNKVIDGDLFKACRDIHIVLISDGQPTFDDCVDADPLPARCTRGGVNYPYRTTLEEIVKLTEIASNIYVHVIGFNLAETDRRACRGANNIDGTPNLSCIHQMAFAGGTDATPNDPTTYAHIAQDAVTLTRTLSRVINGIVDGTGARATVTTTTRTSNRNLGGGQYQFFGSFDVSREHHLWSGNLERLEQSCSGGELQTARIVNFATALNARTATQRQILTPFLDPDKVGSPITESAYIQNTRPGTNFEDELVNLNMTFSTLQTLIGNSELESRFGVNRLSSVNLPYMLDLIRGNQERVGRRLGGINHAHAVIVGGPELDLDIPGYERFANAVSPPDDPRATMVYQGAGTGLHAFDAESTTGFEQFMFLPMDLQDDQALQRASRIHGVDSPPVAADVRMYRGEGAPPDGFIDPVGRLVRDDSGFYDIWSTVLVGGLRGGGRSFYALDVSYPTKPRFLWELNPETEQRRFDVNSADPFLSVTVDKSPAKALMGYSYGRPAVGSVVIKGQNGKRTERGIAILPGGVPENPSSPDGQGYAIYVVELATGQIIRRFTTYENDSGKPFTAPVTGSVAAYNTFPGSVISRAFVGDGKGRMLRVDLRSDDPTKWYVHLFHDTGTATPIQIRPSLSTGRDGRVVAIFGNGDIDNLERRETGNKVVSVSEKIVLNEDGSLKRVDPVVNWILRLGANEKLTGTPLVTNSTAYFPTFVPSTTVACDRGNGRIWAIDFQGNDPDATNDIIGRFDPNGRDFDEDNQDRADVTLSDNRAYFDLNFDSVVIGQLTLASDPVCFDDLPDPDDQDSKPPRVPTDKKASPAKILIPPSGSSEGDIPGLKSPVLTIDPNDPENSEAGVGRAYVFITSWGAVLD